MGGHLDMPFWLDRRTGGRGFSTVGVAIALLITLSLVFTGLQVYRVQSTSAQIQEVADAAALAADNVVAEYYLIARVCDAMVLSLSLTGVIVLGVGIAALCTPYTASIGAAFIKAGKKVLKARDAFAKGAAAGLDRLQNALPFLAAAAAYRVASSNDTPEGVRYLGFAVILPSEGTKVSPGATGSSDALVDAVDAAADELGEAAKEAEKAAQKAKEAKERAYRADCGANPEHCMYERAAALSDLAGGDNPYFSNVDTWGFSIALERARAYYPRRLALEVPHNSSIDEQMRSALRKRFYAYAVDTVNRGFVNESDDSFDADFPLLPKNVSELSDTSLFTEAVYPVSVNGAGQSEMHAWEGCPRAAEAVAMGSLKQRESGEYAICPVCEFTADSLGSVAAASSSIDNGFEYHYRIVAEAAEEYEKAKDASEPKSRRVRQMAGTLFDDALAALRTMSSQRISVAPPGRFGAVAIVASLGSPTADHGLASRLVNGGGALGARVAVSSATLVEDDPEKGRTAISSALDGIRDRTGSYFAGVLDGVMDVWSSVLYAYADGQTRIGEAVDDLDSRLSFGSESRLGLWSSQRFSELVGSLGFQPVNLGAPKPVLVNTAHVLKADGGQFAARLLSVKRVASSLSGDNLLEGVIGAVERQTLQALEGFNGEVTIAQIEIAGEGSPSIPLTISVPEYACDNASHAVFSIAETLRELAGSITGVRQWR